MCCTFVYDLPVKLNQLWPNEQFVNCWVNNEIAKLVKNCLEQVAEVYSEAIFKGELMEKRVNGLKAAN